MMKEAQFWICYFLWTTSGQNQDFPIDNVLISKPFIITDVLLLYAILCTKSLLKISSESRSDYMGKLLQRLRNSEK